MRSVATAALLALAACETPLDVELLGVSDVAPRRIEPGTSLIVSGDGFPVGRTGRVVLDGVAVRPSAEPLAVHVELYALAASGTELVARADDAFVRALGGRSTFAGRLRVEIDARGGGVVSGTLPAVEIDVHPAGGGPPAVALALARRGAALLDVAGISFDDESAAADGLAIAEVKSGSPADLAGVRAGDAVVELSGLTVESVADAVPAPSARAVELVVARPGRAQRITVELALPSAREQGRGWLAAAVAFGALLALFALTPLSRLPVQLAASMAKNARSGRSSPAELSPSTYLRMRAPLAWLAAATALGSLPLVLRVLPRDVDVAAACAIALLATIATERFGGRAAFRVAWLALVLAASICAAAIGAGTSSVAGLVAAQGGWPWEWRIASEPAASLAFVCAAYAGLSHRDAATRADSVLADVADHVRRFSIAALLVSIFLGGHHLPGIPGDPFESTPHLRVASVAIFVAKGAILLLASSRLRAESRAWPLAGALTALSIAAGSLVLAPPPWSGLVACATMLALATAVCIALTSRREPSISPF